ncbi:hypothetical protein 7S2_36 [uncultured Caudovirales phage]|uniref:Uncharacterized protein n=1 Tax=uncultured Caudovirales phage TaxID=2100421 RepID=A0A2H4JBJ7_9CAUD|nr:hypothetical protein 7S2_36 [uncultured Caudovirales phage]
MSENIHIKTVSPEEALSALRLDRARLAYRPNTVGFLYVREGLKLPAPGRRAHALGRRVVAA